MPCYLHRGFTLVELAVTIAVIWILVMLLLPAVQAAREAARRTQCANNIGQLGLALANYEATHDALPPGVVDKQGPILSVPSGYHMSWIVQLLPYMEREAAYRCVDFRVGAYDTKNYPVRKQQIATLHCPSDPGSGWGSIGASMSSYAACHHDVEAPIDQDNHGAFYLNSRLRSREIPDGASHTIYVGERRLRHDTWDYGWMSGTRSTLRNTGTPLNGAFPLPTLAPWLPGSSEAAQVKAADIPAGIVMPGEAGMPMGMGGSGASDAASPEMAPRSKADQLRVGGFGSEHPGVSNFLTGDGAVRTITQTIDFAVYQQLGHRADGKLILNPLP